MVCYLLALVGFERRWASGGHAALRVAVEGDAECLWRRVGGMRSRCGGHAERGEACEQDRACREHFVGLLVFEIDFRTDDALTPGCRLFGRVGKW